MIFIAVQGLPTTLLSVLGKPPRHHNVYTKGGVGYLWKLLFNVMTFGEIGVETLTLPLPGF